MAKKKKKSQAATEASSSTAAAAVPEVERPKERAESSIAAQELDTCLKEQQEELREFKAQLLALQAELVVRRRHARFP